MAKSERKKDWLCGLFNSLEEDNILERCEAAIKLINIIPDLYKRETPYSYLRMILYDCVAKSSRAVRELVELANWRLKAGALLFAYLFSCDEAKQEIMQEVTDTVTVMEDGNCKRRVYAVIGEFFQDEEIFMAYLADEQEEPEKDIPFKEHQRQIKVDFNSIDALLNETSSANKDYLLAEHICISDDLSWPEEFNAAASQVLIRGDAGEELLNKKETEELKKYIMRVLQKSGNDCKQLQ